MVDANLNQSMCHISYKWNFYARLLDNQMVHDITNEFCIRWNYPLKLEKRLQLTLPIQGSQQWNGFWNNAKQNRSVITFKPHVHCYCIHELKIVIIIGLDNAITCRLLDIKQCEKSIKKIMLNHFPHNRRSRTGKLDDSAIKKNWKSFISVLFRFRAIINVRIFPWIQ